jgi:hypothetical protein
MQSAAEVLEKFAKDIEVVTPFVGLAAGRTQCGIKRIHQWSPKSSLKRASSRTKSSKRRLAAVGSRSENEAGALADIAHSSNARWARSPRSLKIRIKSVMAASSRLPLMPQKRLSYAEFAAVSIDAGSR